MILLAEIELKFLTAQWVIIVPTPPNCIRTGTMLDFKRYDKYYFF